MDSQDRRSALERLVVALRKTTRIVKSMPFVYLLFFSVYMVSFPLVSEEASGFIDTLFAGSPVALLGMLFLSNVLKLCRWHKMACLIPSTTRIEGYIDSYVFTFTQNELVAIHLIIGVLSILFICFAFKKVVIDGRQRDYKADA